MKLSTIKELPGKKLKIQDKQLTNWCLNVGFQYKKLIEPYQGCHRNKQKIVLWLTGNSVNNKDNPVGNNRGEIMKEYKNYLVYED